MNTDIFDDHELHEIFDYLRNYQLFKGGLEVIILKPV